MLNNSLNINVKTSTIKKDIYKKKGTQIEI